MTVFVPNVTAQYFRQTGYSAFGEQMFADPVTVKIAIIKFTVLATPTPIRSEASASHGKADEMLAKEGKILVQNTVSPQIDDRLFINGENFRVTGFFPRFDIFGHHDHTEVFLRKTEI
jgi:hypothetical protein